MASMTGPDVVTYSRERPGMSAFMLEDGVVYHTYSCCWRGIEIVNCAYQYLDPCAEGPGLGPLQIPQWNGCAGTISIEGQG
jgi:predicted dithiol-disulfide oxidoreductase (DUF899 family)